MIQHQAQKRDLARGTVFLFGLNKAWVIYEKASVLNTNQDLYCGPQRSLQEYLIFYFKRVFSLWGYDSTLNPSLALIFSLI